MAIAGLGSSAQENFDANLDPCEVGGSPILATSKHIFFTVYCWKLVSYVIGYMKIILGHQHPMATVTKLRA